MSGLVSRRAALKGSAATALGLAAGVAPAKGQAAPSLDAAVIVQADARLRTMVDRLEALQAHADRHAANAGLDSDDPYTLAVAEIDLVAAGMAMTPADTLAGIQMKLRAMAVPIVADDDEAHGLALSVCRDLRRLQATGAVS